MDQQGTSGSSGHTCSHGSVVTISLYARSRRRGLEGGGGAGEGGSGFGGAAIERTTPRERGATND